LFQAQVVLTADAGEQSDFLAAQAGHAAAAATGQADVLGVNEVTTRSEVVAEVVGAHVLHGTRHSAPSLVDSVG
jgi:hypothetical protein